MNEINTNDIIEEDNLNITQIPNNKNEMNSLWAEFQKLLTKWGIEKKYIITTGALLISYVLYQFGYSFLYGYYFGGTNENYLPIADALINSVPFNFKLMIILGIVVLIISTMYLIPVIIMVLENNIKSKIMYGIVHIISIIITWTLISIVSQGIDFKISKNINILIFLILLSAVISSIVSLVNLSFTKPLDLVSGLLWVLILIVIANKFLKFSSFENENIISFLVLSGITLVNFGVPIKKYIKSKNIVFKYAFKCIDYFSIIFFTIIILNYIMELLHIFKNNTFNINIIIKSIIFTIVIVVLEFIKEHKKNKKKQKQEGIIENSSGLNQSIGVSIIRLKDIIFAGSYIFSSAILICMLVYGLMMQVGLMIRENSNKIQGSKITYYATTEKNKKYEVRGRVVAKDGQTYYISKLPENSLMLVKSDYIIVEP